MWLRLLYINHFGREIGHRAWIRTPSDLKNIMDRYNILSQNIIECTIGHNELNNQELEDYIEGGLLK